MERRPYFIFGDLLANLVAGAVIAVATCWLIPTTWGMVLSMVVGMALGMVLALPLSLPFIFLFGAMEVMLPTMVTGMVAGMVGTMSLMGGRLGAASCGSAALVGVAVGAIVMVSSYAANAALSGKDPRWTE